MTAGCSGEHATEGATPFIASVFTIGLAEQSLPQGWPAAILSAGSHGTRDADIEAASCEGSHRSAGAMRCPR